MIAYRSLTSDERAFTEKQLRANQQERAELLKRLRLYDYRAQHLLPAEREYRKFQLRREYEEITRLLEKSSDKTEKHYYVARRNEIELLLEDDLVTLDYDAKTRNAREEARELRKNLTTCDIALGDIKALLTKGVSVAEERRAGRRKK